jgi:ribonuclease HI
MGRLISIYSDGSSMGNSSGPMGWGWLITDWDDILTVGSAGAGVGTNNYAELMGALEGLRAVVDRGWHLKNDIELVSDSQYCLKLADGTYSPTKYVEIVKTLRDLFLITRASARWVPGHSGDIFNDKADELAKAGRDRYMPEEAKSRRRVRRRDEKKRKRLIVKAWKKQKYGY